jgi:hypothetical protein
MTNRNDYVLLCIEENNENIASKIKRKMAKMAGESGSSYRRS